MIAWQRIIQDVARHLLRITPVSNAGAGCSAGRRQERSFAHADLLHFAMLQRETGTAVCTDIQSSRASSLASTTDSRGALPQQVEQFVIHFSTPAGLPEHGRESCRQLQCDYRQRTAESLRHGITSFLIEPSRGFLVSPEMVHHAD